MHTTLRPALFGLIAFALPVACVSLNKGQIVIVEEGAGAPNTGGTTAGGQGKAGSAGTAGSAGSSTGKGGSTGDAGDTGMSSGGTGGSGKGGSSGTGGKGGTGSSGDAGSGGGGGEPPDGCAELDDCVASAPICDDGTCRACVAGAMPDECAELTATPYCDSGRCVACRDNGDCSGSSQSVCDDGVCRGCEEGSECDSGACSGGRCAPESSVVYALAGAGSYDADCGTLAKPCMRLSDAASKLSGTTPYLVLIETSATFTGEVLDPLPPMIDISVIGNHVSILGYNAPVFTKSGGNLYLEDVVVSVARSGTTATDFSAVDLTSVTLRMIKGSIANTSKEYGNVGLNLLDSTADIEQAEFRDSQTAIYSHATGATPGQGFTVERCYFGNNFQAIDVDADHFLIRNNLFVSNGQDSYTRIIRLNMVTSGVFAYNTLYGNDNNCSYEGGLMVCGGGASCGIHSSNLFWSNMYGGTSMMSCYDQVYPYPASLITHTLGEQKYASDATNIDGNLPGNDPRLADPASGDFTPSSGSPAIDAGDTDASIVPDVDYYGNPRPVGDGPDIGAIEAD